MNTLRTTIEILTGDTGYEVEVKIEYRHSAGCSPTMDHPGDDPETEILSIAVLDHGHWVKHDWLDTILAGDEDLLRLCAEDWADDHLAAEEYRAEMRAEQDREEYRIMGEQHFMDHPHG